MSDCSETSNMHLSAASLVDKGNFLKSKLSKSNVDGVQKLLKDIQHEIEFLEKAITSKTLKKHHICSSNFSYFEGVISILEQARDCKAVMKPFYYHINENVRKKIRVDVVTENGYMWIKVTSRNSKSLTQLSVGDCSYNKRNTLNFAKDLTACAKQNPHNYIIPKVVFHFAQGVEAELAQKLEYLGVIISGNVLKHDGNSERLPSTCSEPLTSCLVAPYESFPEVINLDVSTMIAYVSSVSNGGTGFKFKEKILNEQVQQELANPLKPQLDKIFSGKKLICCETALCRIKCILDTIGGVKEKMRFDSLQKHITVVPDVKTHENLTLTARLKEPSLTVFCTGHAHKAMTVSANKGFFHAAQHQGVEFSAWLHRSCALTEKKENISEIQNM